MQTNSPGRVLASEPQADAGCCHWLAGGLHLGQPAKVSASHHWRVADFACTYARASGCAATWERQLVPLAAPSLLLQSAVLPVRHRRCCGSTGKHSRCPTDRPLCSSRVVYAYCWCAFHAAVVVLLCRPCSVVRCTAFEGQDCSFDVDLTLVSCVCATAPSAATLYRLDSCCRIGPGPSAPAGNRDEPSNTHSAKKDYKHTQPHDAAWHLCMRCADIQHPASSPCSLNQPRTHHSDHFSPQLRSSIKNQLTLQLGAAISGSSNKKSV